MRDFRRPGSGTPHLTLELHFVLEATAEEVVYRLSRCMRGTDLRLVHLLGEGELLYPLRAMGTARRARGWRAVVGPRPGLPLRSEEVERVLAQAEEHLPARTASKLVGAPRPSARDDRPGRAGATPPSPSAPAEGAPAPPRR